MMVPASVYCRCSRAYGPSAWGQRHPTLRTIQYNVRARAIVVAASAVRWVRWVPREPAEPLPRRTSLCFPNTGAPVLVSVYSSFLPGDWSKEDLRLGLIEMVLIMDAMSYDLDCVRTGAAFVTIAQGVGWKNYSVRVCACVRACMRACMRARVVLGPCPWLCLRCVFGLVKRR